MRATDHPFVQHPLLIDIGVNLVDKAFRSDLETVCERARAAGVHGLVITGTNREESRAAADLAAKQPGMWSTAGVHPHYVRTCDGDTLAALRALATRAEVVAIGECGLDYFRDLSPRDVQRHWLSQQLSLAAELAMPVFLHDRDAHSDMMAILREHRDAIPRGVVHCFTGTGDELDTYLELDLHIGITGWICDERRGTHLRDLVSKIPADRLMLETDSPYLLPRTIRPRPKSRRNEPAYLPHVLQAVAECRDEDPWALARATTSTAQRFFGVEFEDSQEPRSTSDYTA